MIRHICMFKLKEGANGCSKDENLKEALELLNGMKGMELIQKFEVVTNYGEAPESNYDISLIFDFKNMDDLNEYQKHPKHLEFGEFITNVRENRACIDYEY